ncbi:UbiH/UbiF family hydroxylase [Hydrogenophilus islandicus]
MSVIDYDIVINGGGLAGSSLALALGNAGWRVLLIEPSPPPPSPPADDAFWQPRIYAYAPRPWGWLERLAVPLPSERTQPVARMVVKGDRAGVVAFAASEAALPYLAVIGEAESLRSAIWRALADCETVTCATSAGATLQGAEVRWDGVILTTQDGRSWQTRLVVGAEGRQSWVRQFAGIQAENFPYGHSAVVANFVTEKEHDATAYQWFRRDGVLAYLPLPGHRVSIVWSTPEDHAQTLIAMKPNDFARTVAEAGERVLGSLTLLTPPQMFPLSLMRCDRVTAKRVMIIGDAAHGIHPLSGHGINLGFNDAAVLAEEIGPASLGRDPGDPVLLARYAQRRREEPLLLQTVTDWLAKGFAVDASPIRLLRNWGMSWVDHLPIVKRRLIRYATLAQW